MDLVVTLVLYIVLGVIGSGTYVLALKVWGEPLEVYRRLLLGAVGGFLVFLLVLAGLIQMFVSWVASLFGGQALMPIDSPAAFILAFFLGGYWCVDFISALADRFKPTLKQPHSSEGHYITPTEQLTEIEKDTELGRMFLNAQRKLMVHEATEKGMIMTFSDEQVLNELKARVQAGKEEAVYVIR